MLQVKLVKSPIGNTPKNRATVKALGLRKINQTITHEDNPTIRGMIFKVKHLLSVTVSDEDNRVKKPSWKRKSKITQEDHLKTTAAEVSEVTVDEKPKSEKPKKTATAKTKKSSATEIE